MNELKIKKILLIRRRAMGDALVSLPAIAEVRRLWPVAEIDLVIDRPFATLIAGMAPYVNVLSYPPAEGISWLGFLRSGNYDLVIDWLSTPRTALWTLFTGAPIRVGYDLRRRWWAYNIRVPRNQEDGQKIRSFAGESFLDPLRALGYSPPPWQGGICAGRDFEFPDGSVRSSILDWNKKWIDRGGSKIAVVMSATWSAKSWPVEHIQKLMALMSDASLDPVLIPGPGDAAMGDLVAGSWQSQFRVPPTNLPELLHLLQSADLFVGTDCGVRHLAGSLGLPTVTLFGPTDAGGWNPSTPKHVSVQVGESCSPCDLTSCPLAGHPCMSNLVPEMVMEAVSKSLIAHSEERTT